MEPEIIINGIRMGDGCSMTIRSGIENFAIFLSAPHCLGDDVHGIKMRELYTMRVGDIRRALLANQALHVDKKTEWESEILMKFSKKELISLLRDSFKNVVESKSALDKKNDLIQKANNYLSGGGFGAFSVQKAAELFDNL